MTSRQASARVNVASMGQPRAVAVAQVEPDQAVAVGPTQVDTASQQNPTAQWSPAAPPSRQGPAQPPPTTERSPPTSTHHPITPSRHPRERSGLGASPQLLNTERAVSDRA